jgi:LysM repeat protein
MSDRSVTVPDVDPELGGADLGVADRPPGIRPSDSRAAADLCPFLASEDRDWRAAVAIREHRCTAVEPVAVLTLEKQRRLCLGRDHATCATYLAARQRLVGDDVEGPPEPSSAEQGAGPGVETGRPVTRWVVPRTAPVVLDRGRPSIGEMLARRSTTQVALVALMALAFVVLALARLSAGDAGAQTGPYGTAPSGAPAPSGSLGATPLAPSASPVASASAAASGTPTSVPSASPPPPTSADRTYRVVAGDTLSGIAARFGVPVGTLESANGITNPSLIRVGTVLVIP